MIEAARILRTDHDWESAFYSSGHDPSTLEAAFASGNDCFVVVDYAETRPQEVVALARAALRASGRIRLALLARAPGAWWERLADGVDGDLKLVLESPSSKTGPFRIEEEGVPVELRSVIFNEALGAFAAEKGLVAEDVVAPDLSGESFGDVLFIHLAALAKLRGHEVQGDEQLIDHVLEHERAYWRHLLKEHEIAEVHLEDLEQVVAYLTLTGGTHSAKASREIIASTPRLQDASPELKLKIFDLLRKLYKSNGGITGLLPDVLGERLVARALDEDDELLEATLGANASSEVARQSLTVLTRLAQRIPRERRWLTQALRDHLPERRREAREVAAETGGPMPEILMNTLTVHSKLILDSASEWFWMNCGKTFLETLYIFVTLQPPSPNSGLFPLRRRVWRRQKYRCSFFLPMTLLPNYFGLLAAFWKRQSTGGRRTTKPRESHKDRTRQTSTGWRPQAATLP